MAKSPFSMNMTMFAFWIPFFFIFWLSASMVADRRLIPRRATCPAILFPRCPVLVYLCPPDCSVRCFVNCATCRPVCSCNFPGAVCQDPRFVGGDGITFYFHGRKDQDFCLVSDTNLHINAHFIDKRNPNLKRDFTWVQTLGIKFDNHTLLIGAKKTATWNDNVDRLDMSFDNISIFIPTTEGSKWNNAMATTSITRASNANEVVVEVANNFRVNAVVVPITVEESRVHGYNITKEDSFAHLELRFKFYNLSDMVDGILGQTYRSDYVSKTKVNVPMPVMGGIEKYSSSSIFATDCGASRFRWKTSLRDGASALYPSMECISGMKGNGVVCKK